MKRRVRNFYEGDMAKKGHFGQNRSKGVARARHNCKIDVKNFEKQAER